MQVKSFRSTIISITAVLLAGLAVGCNSQNNSQAAHPRALPEVAVVTITPRPVALTTDLPGRTSAFQVAEIRPQVNGIIKEILFREGADVKAGQPLFRIDATPFQVAYDSAAASLGRAQAQLPSIQLRVQRYQELLADNAVSRQDFDDASAALQQVEADIAYWKAALEAARINLAYTVISAPFDGRLGISHVRIGTLVTAYQPAPLAVLQQLDPIYVDVVQSSVELLRLRRGLESGKLSANGDNRRKVDIFLEDGTAYPDLGTLQFADVTVDPSTGSYTLRIVVPNPQHLLLPGMFVRAVVGEGTIPQAILAPQQGVSRNTKGEAVALVVNADNKSELRILELDRAIGNDWLVTGGLNADERLIVEGMSKIKPGDQVNAVPAATPSAAPNAD